MQTRYGDGDERYRYARPTDIEAIAAMLADPEVARWLWWLPAPDATIHEFFRPLIDAQWQELADGQAPTQAVFVVEAASGEFLGQGAAIEVDGSADGFEIGYQLCSEAWGRGVGTRLAEFLAVWAVHEHAAYRIQAGCLEGNLASRAILERLGLALEGTRIDYRLKEDTRHNEREYGARVADLDPKMLDRARERAGFES